MASSIVVLDYGSGNLRSAERALARAGGAVTDGRSASLTTPAQSITTFLINQAGS